MGDHHRGDQQPVGRCKLPAPTAIQLGRQRGDPAVQLPDRVRHRLLLQYRLPQLGLDAIDLGLSASGELLQSSVVLDRGG